MTREQKKEILKGMIRAYGTKQFENPTWLDLASSIKEINLTTQLLKEIKVEGWSK